MYTFNVKMHQIKFRTVVSPDPLHTGAQRTALSQTF